VDAAPPPGMAMAIDDHGARSEKTEPTAAWLPLTAAYAGLRKGATWTRCSQYLIGTWL
jgi:hypothetical protein